MDDIRFPRLTGGGAVPADEVFGFAACVLTAGALESVMGNLADAKVALGLGEADPVKHSVDDRVSRIFARHYGERDGREKFDIAKANAFEITRATLGDVAAVGGRVVASACWPFSPTPASADLSRWAWENLLQRVGYMLRSDVRPWGSVVILADRPETDPMCESFVDAVYHGRTTGGTGYHSGPLAGLGVVPALGFVSTPHSPPLQVADYVARACRDFLVWCHRGRRMPALMVPLVPAFHRDASGVIDGRGFVVTPSPGFTVDEKVEELLTAARAAAGE